MNVNELRVDNIVYINRGTLRPHVINIGDFCGGQDKFDLFEPFPLTEDFLLKNGAKKDEYDEFTYSYFVLEYRKERKAWKVSEKGHHMAYITYLHQLQNLYFSLTGEELELKPMQTQIDIPDSYLDREKGKDEYKPTNLELELIYKRFSQSVYHMIASLEHRYLLNEVFSRRNPTDWLQRAPHHVNGPTIDVILLDEFRPSCSSPALPFEIDPLHPKVIDYERMMSLDTRSIDKHTSFYIPWYFGIFGQKHQNPRIPGKCRNSKFNRNVRPKSTKNNRKLYR